MHKPTIAGLGLLAAIAAPAHAQLITEKALSLSTALTIATTALDTCKANGNKVSVTVLGREGQVIVQMRGDGSSPHTIENSQRKAYTSRTFRIPSGEFANRMKDNPRRAADQGRRRCDRRRRRLRLPRRRQGRSLRQGRDRQGGGSVEVSRIHCVSDDGCLL
jgi:hypothetical protein